MCIGFREIAGQPEFTTPAAERRTGVVDVSTTVRSAGGASQFGDGDARPADARQQSGRAQQQQDVAIVVVVFVVVVVGVCSSDVCRYLLRV